MRDPTARIDEILIETDSLEASRELLRIAARKIHEELNVISYTLANLRRELMEIPI